MKFEPYYICKLCYEKWHREDVIRHYVSEHDADWRGSFEDALELYEIVDNRLRISKINDGYKRTIRGI